MNEEARIDLLRSMWLALTNVKYGMKLGIAAPQIGVSLRVIVVQGVPMFNPEWRPAAQLVQQVEACYSVPDRFFRVWRAKYGWAAWQDEKGNPRELKLIGTRAIIFQHELDHLNGLCCNTTGTEIIKPTPMGESRLNQAIHTPIEELTDEQAQLLIQSWSALSEEEKAKLTEAGIFPEEEVDAKEEVSADGEVPETPKKRKWFGKN